MIKIKLFEPDIHRNETTYRPYLLAQNYMKEVGIEFVYDAVSYDFLLIGQASIINKKQSLKESVEWGLNKLKNITGDYIIIDGQDSSSLIGTIDVFRHVYNDKNCKLFLKTNYLKNKDLYKEYWNTGRIYWGNGGKYNIPDIDNMLSKMKLCGYNWLSTIEPKWMNYDSNKLYDIWAYFQYPMGKIVYEHEEIQSDFYDEFRSGLHKKLNQLDNKYKILKMKDGKRVSLNDYYQMMYDSKIVIAAFGYGEIAPRDIESAMFGNILFKNNMDHIETIPNIYNENTYISLNWNWIDLEEKINYIILNFHKLQQYYVENMKTIYLKENNFINRTVYLYNLLKNIEGITYV